MSAVTMTSQNHYIESPCVFLSNSWPLFGTTSIQQASSKSTMSLKIGRSPPKKPFHMGFIYSKNITNCLTDFFGRCPKWLQRNVVIQVEFKWHRPFLSWNLVRPWVKSRGVVLRYGCWGYLKGAKWEEIRGDV